MSCAVRNTFWPPWTVKGGETTSVAVGDDENLRKCSVCEHNDNRTTRGEGIRGAQEGLDRRSGRRFLSVPARLAN